MKNDLIPPLPRREYAEVAVELVRRRAKSPNGTVWTHDAWHIINNAIADVRGDMISASPCAAMMYVGYMLLAFEYLKAFPNADKYSSLLTGLVEDMHQMVVCVEHMVRTKAVDMKDNEQLREAVLRARAAARSL